MSLHVRAWLSACLLAGCLGGQTGESTSDPGTDHAAPPRTCEPNGIVLDIDRVLPAGHSARDILDRYTAEPIEVQAFVVPDERLHDESYTLTAEDVGPERQLFVRIEYLGDDEIPLHDGPCMWNGELALPVRLTVSGAVDGVPVEHVAEGVLAGLPEAFAFYEQSTARPDGYGADDDGGAELCPIHSHVALARNGTPTGQICDQQGRVIRLATPCGGFAQTSELNREVLPELPTPAEAIAEIEAEEDIEVQWAGRRAAVRLAATPGAESICYQDNGPSELTWMLPVTLQLRAEQLDVSANAMLVVQAHEPWSVVGSPVEKRIVTLEPCPALDGPNRAALAESSGLALSDAWLCASIWLQEREVEAGTVSVRGIDTDAKRVEAAWSLHRRAP